ncbi:DUF1353 domain-containing protein [Bradyrhizobium sp.]|uniref:DUF1353 domain-containing protein n=1 Tax=Bradyrhizobium sp. TaxID=376 RepID=UPI0034161C1F
MRLRQNSSTDFANIPRLLWSLFTPIGRYGYAAVFHDCVCWEQDARRPTASSATDGRAWRAGSENAYSLSGRPLVWPCCPAGQRGAAGQRRTTHPQESPGRSHDNLGDVEGIQTRL